MSPILAGVGATGSRLTDAACAADTATAQQKPARYFGKLGKTVILMSPNKFVYYLVDEKRFDPT
jgi:hypothetical protein